MDVKHRIRHTLLGEPVEETEHVGRHDRLFCTERLLEQLVRLVFGPNVSKETARQMMRLSQPRDWSFLVGPHEVRSWEEP